MHAAKLNWKAWSCEECRNRKLHSVHQKIKLIARKARVPVIENKTLARSLYRQVDIGNMIPDNLFQAVAEVLAYVYRLKRA